MAASGQKLVCLNGLNLDVAPEYMNNTQARYVKNLYYQLSDFGDADTGRGKNTGKLKPLPSNVLYAPFDLPDGDNHVIGTCPSRETNELYVFVCNTKSNHFIFRINGLTDTIDVGVQNSCFNFQLNPKYFIGEGQCHLEIDYVINPDTGEQKTIKDLYWTDGYNFQGYLRFDDYLATKGFDENTFSYFKGDYDKCTLLRMGLPTPNDCIEIAQKPFDITEDSGKNNNLKFAAWQFRVLDIDVYGRPSEHGIISDLVYISNNACLGASDNLSRCFNLTFPAGNPLVDKKQIEYRNCNSEQWYLDSVLDLYNGSNLNNWWLRERNTDINYNPDTNEITYTFCKDKLCDPIDISETNRNFNPLARVSQSIAKVGNSIDLSNNKDGFPPVPKTEINKLSIEIIPPDSDTIGLTSNIEIYVRIYCPHIGKYEKVWLKGKDYVWGGVEPTNNGVISNIKDDYHQYFVVPNQSGFIGYLAGTNNYAVGVQYYLDDNNNFIKDTIFNTDIQRQYFMKFEFLSVPKQNYIFRIASSLADSSQIDVRTTSAPIGGVFEFSNLKVGQVLNNKTHELKINVCDTDYSTLTSGEMLLIYDLTCPVAGLAGGVFSTASIGDGYIYADKNADTGQPENPVSLLQLVTSTSGRNVVTSYNTDHNGYYYTSALKVKGTLSDFYDIMAYGYCNCVKKVLTKIGIGTNYKRYTSNAILTSPSIQPFTNYCPDFWTLSCSKVLIKGKINLCGTGIGIPNIPIVITRGGSTVTDNEGNFSLIAYDDAINGNTQEELYIMGGACSFTMCDGSCIKLIDVSYTPCSSCTDRNLTVATVLLSTVNSRGLLSNGQYGVCLYAYDWLGRQSFAQTDDKLYFTVPSLNSTNTFGFSTINLIIPPDFTFPDYADYFTVGLTPELNYGGNYITWIADKVTFIDNTGNENLAAPTQIRIDYGSLNQYNTQNNFNTTTGWQIIPSATTSPRTGDIVQFIKNGDGTWFNNPQTALVKYDQAGLYFLIDYNASLLNLKENALIRIANPETCTNKNQFFELCGKYEIENTKSVINKITLNAYDTYYQYRQIPVPKIIGTPPNTTTINELRQFGFPFEHPSVTDTWGYLCWNIGRFNVKNPYENEIISIDQHALSGSLSVNAQLNYLNYFDDNNKYSPIVANSGGIVYVRPKTGIVLVVCQNINYLIGFNDNIPTTNADGQLIIPSASNKFGNPYRDSVVQYGCQLFDKSTIRERDGLCAWLDRSRVAILHNDYKQCVDVSRYNKADSTIISWLTSKIKYQNEYNKNNGNTRYFHSVINPLNFEWIMSEFTIGATSDSDYVNQEREENVSLHETISFDMVYKLWKQFMSFTPQMFGYLENTSEGQIIFSFKDGLAWAHSGDATNTFFGIKCENVYRFVFNLDGFKKKKMQSIWVYCPDVLYWSDQVITEKQTSRILKSSWKKQDYFYAAPFLCNVNTNPDPNIPAQTGANVIMDGDNLFGSWADIRLINADNVYSELYGTAVFAAADEQSGG